MKYVLFDASNGGLLDMLNAVTVYWWCFSSKKSAVKFKRENKKVHLLGPYVISAHNGGYFSARLVQRTCR